MSNAKLPERPSLEYLKKLAKSRLQELRREDPPAKPASVFPMRRPRSIAAHLQGALFFAIPEMTVAATYRLSIR